MRKLTTAEVIQRARQKHGNRYLHHATKYTGATVKITVTCRQHGDWQVLPHQYMEGSHCPKCAAIAAGRRQRKPVESIVPESLAKFGDRFSVRIIKQAGMQSAIEVTCHRHQATFETTAICHLRSKHGGCRQCAGEAISKGRRVSLEDFNARVQQRHGEHLQAVSYTACQEPAEFACSLPGHGKFTAIAVTVLEGNLPPCNECRADRRQQQFIAKASRRHEDRLDYSEVEYVDSKTPVKIRCKEHGVRFTQTPSDHLTGAGGCPVCCHERIKSARVVDESEAMERFEQAHSDRYLYDRVKYKDAGTPVLIGCREPGHGYFWQTPGDHWRGHGCVKCGRELSAKKRTTPPAKYLQMVMDKHGDKFDLSRTDYRGRYIKITVGCPEHGWFDILPGDLIYSEYGCQQCGKAACGDYHRSSTAEFNEKATEKHQGRYGYDRVDYQGNNHPVDVFCKKCECYFKQKPADHLGGAGCPRCVRSRAEVCIADLLDSLGIPYRDQWTHRKCLSDKGRLLKFDFFLPEHNLLIEADGEQHYIAADLFGGEPALRRRQQLDAIKTNFAGTHGYRLLRIPFWKFARIPQLLDAELDGIDVDPWATMPLFEWANS